MYYLDVYQDCHQIHKKRAKKNPNGNHEYAIDPDQGGPVEPFGVTCDFKTNRNMGITVVCNIFCSNWAMVKLVPLMYVYYFVVADERGL